MLPAINDKSAKREAVERWLAEECPPSLLHGKEVFVQSARNGLLNIRIRVTLTEAKQAGTGDVTAP